MPYCENCGNMVSSSTKFCSNCGISITKEKNTMVISTPKNNPVDTNPTLVVNSPKREVLIKLLLKKYINEYLYILIISSAVAVVSFFYYLLTLSDTAISWTVFAGLFAVVSLFVLLSRLYKRNRLGKTLVYQLEPNEKIWAEKQTDKIHRPGMWGHETHSIVLHAFDKSFVVPESLLPFPIDECVDIINSKIS